MSAYFCSNSVFHLIATYASSLSTPNRISSVWRSLIKENLASMNHRYPRDQADNISQARAALAAITDRPMLPMPDPSVIKSALTEYRYQSCEHPAYTTSAAGQLVAQLLATIEQPAAVSPDGGWYDTDTIATPPQPAPPTPAPAPAPEADPIETARASLLAAFNAPAATEPEPPAADPLETITSEAKARALSVLLTLSQLANGSADADRFSQLADRIGNSLGQSARANAAAEAARNVAAIGAVWSAA
jgi:hypothetical protein